MGRKSEDLLIGSAVVVGLTLFGQLTLCVPAWGAGLLWAWFAVPLGAPETTFWQMYGLLLLTSFVKGGSVAAFYGRKTAYPRGVDLATDVGNSIESEFGQLLTVLILVGAGYLVKGLI